VLKRRKLREALIKILYASKHNNRGFISNLQDLVEMSRDIDENIPLIDDEDEEYLKNVLTDIEKNKINIDSILKKVALKWSLDRILDMDKSILELAIYELLYREDIPVEVTINEAIEIAKKYSGEESYSFVNGILDTVAKKYVRINKRGR
jgi:N utilization substance protein B